MTNEHEDCGCIRGTVECKNHPGHPGNVPRYTAAPQTGPKGNCLMAQVFGPDGKSVLVVEPTSDPLLGTLIAQRCADALSGRLVPAATPLNPPSLLRAATSMHTNYDWTRWKPCNEGCDPEFGGCRSRHCVCDAAKASMREQDAERIKEGARIARQLKEPPTRPPIMMRSADTHQASDGSHHRIGCAIFTGNACTCHKQGGQL